MFECLLERRKSIYHQPSLTKFNPAEKNRRKHRRRSQQTGERADTTSKSATNNENSDSYELGKNSFFFR
jgi:hypothetical protein